MSETSPTIESILTPGLTLCCVPGSSKKKVLEQIAHYVTSEFPDLDETSLYNSLLNRERLGSTGIGQGIAIPHCRLENCHKVIGVLLTLSEPIPFDAIDNEPVDLLFALIVPQEATGEHLELLSQLAERFNEAAFCNRLRACKSQEALYQAMTGADILN